LYARESFYNKIIRYYFNHCKKIACFREDFYPDELPKAEDVLLLIEVADTKAFPDISLTAKQIIG